MKRVLKWIGAIAALLVVLGAVLVVAVNVAYERKRDRIVALDVKGVTVVTDEAALARGKYLFASRGCAECHGANGSGRVFIDDPASGFRARSPNITSGGATGNYSEVDWVRVIRHGVKKDGRAVFIMPSEDYNRLTDADVAALIAYVRSLPPAPGGAAEFHVPLPLRALYGFGAVPDAAEKIDHSLPASKPVAEAVTPEHGKYVAGMCFGCHGAHLSGGKIAGGPPDWPPAANLTPGEGSIMLVYDTPEKFKAMFRSGKRPNGTPIPVMPFESLRALNDTDVEALFLYLKTLPPRPFGEH
jgi:mono/diheme cytochrome c family protein